MGWRADEIEHLLLVTGERGQGNFELVANFGYIHEGQLTLAKAYVALHPEEAASGRFRR